MIEPPNNKQLRDLDFKCGLEIHQQLKTAKKLFCRCPAGLRNDPPHARIIRHMRPTLSELGEYDGTALMEFKTRKTVIYELYRESVCTYEMDDTPPFLVNQEALDIAIEIALLLNCSIVDELHISRKQYLDGSIPTGFQRTAIVGVNGWMPYKDRKIGIIQLALEEDACREIDDTGHTIIFRADRLSIPLVEVVTEPDMMLPDEVAEVNWEIGRIMRSTGKVRRGIGSVRQDVNVSIEGGTRVEIKGVPRIPLIPDLTRLEGMRQQCLLKIRDTLRARGLSDKTFSSKDVDVTDRLRRSDFSPLRQALGAGGCVRAVRLDGFAGILGSSVGPTHSLADEIAGRVRVVACLDGHPNITHDEAQTGTLAAPEWEALKERCECKHTDALVVVWGPSRDVEVATSEIKIRAQEATMGVPSETRQVLRQGETDFERILPGPDRMYPDTDHPPLAIADDRIEAARRSLPLAVGDARAGLSGAGLDRETSDRIIDLGMADIYLSLIRQAPQSSRRIDRLLLNDLVHLRRQGVSLDDIGRDRIAESVKMAEDGLISWEGLRELLKTLAFNDGAKVGDLAEAFGHVLLPQDEAETEIAKALDAAHQRGIKFRRPGAVMSYLRQALGFRVRGSLMRRKAAEFMTRKT
jgi:glutamyl-tRNA(Gln) amidotransferase subunit E